MTFMDTAESNGGERSRRHRREALSLNAVECAYVRELGRQLNGHDAPLGGGERLRHIEGHAIDFLTAMNSQPGERLYARPSERLYAQAGERRTQTAAGDARALEHPYRTSPPARRVRRLLAAAAASRS